MMWSAAEAFSEAHLDRMTRKFSDGPERRYAELGAEQKARLRGFFQRHGLPERGAEVGITFTRQRRAANTLVM